VPVYEFSSDVKRRANQAAAEGTGGNTGSYEITDDVYNEIIP
jgi:hypothetical protein